MSRIKTFSFWLSVFIFAFLLTYQPIVIKAQSVEDLHGIESGIGGGGEAAPAEEDNTNYTVYIVAGALIIGLAVYYLVKYVEKKRPPLNKEQEKAQLEKLSENEQTVPSEKPESENDKKLLKKEANVIWQN